MREVGAALLQYVSVGAFELPLLNYLSNQTMCAISFD